MSNKLNKLLENAKNESPLLTESEIISVFNNRNLLGKKQTFFTLKNIFIMLVISSIIVGLWIGFYPTETPNLAKQTPVNSPKNKEQLTEKFGANNLLANAHQNNKTAPIKDDKKILQTTDNFKKLFATNNKQEPKLFEPIPFTPLINQNPIDDNRIYFDKDGYLVLTNEELAKLGIITDGNVLKYENVTDTVINVLENNNMVKKNTFFGININEGGISIDHDFKNDDEIINNSLSFWPAYITTKSTYYSKKRAIKKDSSFAIVDWLFGFGDENNFIEEISPLLIPITVNLKSNNSGKLSTEKQIIFWFKTEQLFYKQLEENVAKAAKNDFGISSIDQYKKVLQKYRNKSRNGAAPYGIDSVLSILLQKRYIEPQQNQFKDLNIFKKKNFFLYKTYCKIDNKTKVLVVKALNNETTISENYSKKESFSKFNSKILAVALTDTKIKNINYLKIYSDSVSFFEKMDIEEKYFRENIQKLIPIKVDANHVIWFEPTEELKRILDTETKIEIQQIDLTKIKILEFEEKELLNLGVKMKKNEITLPIVSYGNQGQFTTYKKNGSVSNIIPDSILSAKFKRLAINTNLKPKYSVPYLVTDETGMNWRTYRFDTEKDDSNDVKFYLSIMKRISNFIPIKITSGNISIIAWYEPDSLFLSLLPNTESTEIKTEYHAISNNLPAPSCKYFEVCQNINGKINSYLAYPNPAEQTLNIEIDLAEERNLEFIITDITGKIIKTLNQNLSQAKGVQTYTYQIGELTEGMYLLIITTDKGEKVSTRIVKK